MLGELTATKSDDGGELPVQRGSHFCLVDEADSILIDEARTPLIIGSLGDKAIEKIVTMYRWAAQNVDKKLITEVSVFDVYEGKGIDETKKSIAIAVTIQPRDKTMTDEEIDAVGAKIVAEVTKKTGGTLRA